MFEYEVEKILLLAIIFFTKYKVKFCDNDFIYLYKIVGRRTKI